MMGAAIIDWYALYREAFRCYKPADINMKCDDGSVSRAARCTNGPIGSWATDPRLKKLGQFSRLVLESDAEGLLNTP